MTASTGGEAASQRERAEEIVSRRGTDGMEGDGTASPEMTRKLLYDLRVHQIELEMQNEELRRTQIELETSQSRYFDLYDLAPVGYVTLDHKGRIQESNLTAAGLLGEVRSKLVKQPLARFILPADQDIYFRHRQQVLDACAPQICELRLSNGDHEPLWAQLQSAVPQSVDGEPVYRVVIIDVTERRRAEEVLRASEARHRIMIEACGDALVTLLPPRWKFTSGNSAAITMFCARDEADLLSGTFAQHFAEHQPDGSDSREKLQAPLDQAMNGTSQLFPWTFRRPSGEEYLTTVRLTRIEIAGRPLLQATVRDETPVKKLEAMLAQADRLSSMGMLAAGVFHEISNPLVYVLYNVESLASDLPRIAAGVGRCCSALRTEVGESAFLRIAGDAVDVLEPRPLDEAVERTREAFAGIQRIQTIARALGTFSRVESNTRCKVDLNGAIEFAITMAFNQIKFRATLVREFGQVPLVWASEGKLSQVFLNLLINAAHAMDEATFDANRITIRTWTAGHDVFAEVADTGKGIAPENLARIFEPFFTTKITGGGSGLGLAICRDIASEFGGDIHCESEAGQGSRFRLRLPVPPVTTPSPLPLLDHGPAPAVVRGRVLLIDDEELILKGMTRLLGHHHDVLTADSGESARAILELDQAFDAIVCDLMMPRMTGMDLHRWLVEHHPRLAGQVAFISGGAFTPDARAYLSGVRNLKLQKPIAPEALKRLVTDLILASRALA